MLNNVQLFKFALVASAAVSLAACESSGSYRLASVGSVPDGGGTASSSGGDGSSSSSSGGTASSSGGTGSSGGASSGGTASSGGGSSSSSSGGAGTLGSGLIVTAGNAVIGVAGKHQQLANQVNGALPAATPVTAIVTRVLTKTGQTLVNLGNGNSLILNKAGGKIGDIVKIDLGSKTVIGAPSGSALLGVGVLSPTGSGNLATVTTGALPGTGSLSGVTGAIGTVTAPITTTVTTVTAGAGAGGSLTTPITTVTGGAGAGGSVTTTVTNTVGGVLGGLTTKK